MEVLTVGHSNRPYDAFLEILQAHGVERLVDVRTVPKSRAVPWSAGAELAPRLGVADVDYVHLKALGGLRKPLADSPNGAWRNLSFRGYADHMTTPAFREGVDRLLELAREERTVVMCAEAVPWRCHRSLVADALVARGVAVRHLMTRARADPHRLTPFAKVAGDEVRYPAGPRQSTLAADDA